MNLHAVASPIVAAINPPVTAGIQRSTGTIINADGSRTPTYAPTQYVPVQMQSLQYNDIAQLDALNVQGERRALYVNGNLEGLVRADQRGGDLVTMPNGDVWLVALVLENWAERDGWVKVAVTRQIA